MLEHSIVVAETKCVVFDTISKFSYLLHIAQLPYDGQLSVN